MIYTNVFTPFRIADARCLVAPESEWQDAATFTGRVLIDCDLFAEWEGHLVDQSGLVLHKSFLAWMRMEPLTLSDVVRRVFDLIDATPRTTWIVRTERPENVAEMMPGVGWVDDRHRAWPERPNLWLGITAKTQAELDERLPKLLAITAAKRFVDLVPSEAIDLSKKLGRHWECPECGDDDVNGKWPITDKRTYYCGLCAEDCGRDVRLRVGKHVIDWVAVRGDADPLHPDWVRSLRDQATSAGVPFAFEGWGEWAHTPHGFECRTQADNWFLKPDGTRCHDGSSKRSACMSRVGRERSGRQLDGREWSEVPA